jgi:SEC-C motif
LSANAGGKLGRNDPCRCGSGKKYKRCCLEREQAERLLERERLETEAKLGAGDTSEGEGEPKDLGECDAVRKLIAAGALDEAEQLSRRMEAESPGETTGIECLALVYEARGQHQVAADHYRRAVSMMDALGRGHFCDCCRARMVKAVRRLDPLGPAPARGLDPR